MDKTRQHLKNGEEGRDFNTISKNLALLLFALSLPEDSEELISGNSLHVFSLSPVLASKIVESAQYSLVHSRPDRSSCDLSSASLHKQVAPFVCIPVAPAIIPGAAADCTLIHMCMCSKMSNPYRK